MSEACINLFVPGFASFEYEKDKWNRVSHHDDDYDNGACRVYLFTQPDCAGYGSSPGSFIETYGQCGEMNTMPVPGRSVAVSCEGKDVVAWEQVSTRSATQAMLREHASR